MTIALIVLFGLNILVYENQALLSSRLIEVETSYQYQGFNFITSGNYHNQLLTFNIDYIVGGITAIVLLFNIKQIRGILEEVIDGNSFSLEVVKYLKKIGFGIMMGSVVISIAFHLFNIVDSLNQLGVSINFWWPIIDQSLILEGLLILLLAHIFQYGIYLQEEYDAAL